MIYQKKILILSAIFFISGFSFFYSRMNQKTENHNYNISSNIDVKKGKENTDIVLKNMPDPKKFQTFTYKNQDSIEIKIECDDIFSTILIYNSKTDYRYDPLNAKLNTAYPCEKSTLKKEIHLEKNNFQVGEEYYIIRAQQSKTGMWYNPY